MVVQQFEALGGHITNFTSFGEDPLRSHPNLVAEREAKFHEQYPDFTEFFHTIVNGDSSLLCQGIIFLIDLSKRLQNSMSS